MMRSMRQTAGHHPRSGSLYIEERRQFLPPALVCLPEYRESISAVFRITFHEFDTRFVLRQRRSMNVEPQHVATPQILAHALMHHLLVHAASTGIVLIRTHRKVLVFELTPYTQDLQSLGCVALDQKLVFHSFCSPKILLSVNSWLRFYPRFQGSAPGRLRRGGTCRRLPDLRGEQDRDVVASGCTRHRAIGVSCAGARIQRNEIFGIVEFGLSPRGGEDLYRAPVEAVAIDAARCNPGRVVAGIDLLCVSPGIRDSSLQPVADSDPSTPLTVGRIARLPSCLVLHRAILRRSSRLAADQIQVRLPRRRRNPIGSPS